MPQARSAMVSPGLGHDIDHRLDQSTRGEVLAGAGLGVRAFFSSSPLVGIALHVGAHHRPVFLVDQVHQQAAQRPRVLELVLGLLKISPSRPFPAQRIQAWR